MTPSLNTFNFKSISLGKGLSIYLSYSKYKVKIFDASDRLVDITLIAEAVVEGLISSQQIFYGILIYLENTHIANLVWIL